MRNLRVGLVLTGLALLSGPAAHASEPEPPEAASDHPNRLSVADAIILGVIEGVNLTGAAALKSYKGGAAMLQVFDWPNVLLGGVVAPITAAVCVWFLVHCLTRHGLVLFAWYRIALAAVLAVAFYL